MMTKPERLLAFLKASTNYTLLPPPFPPEFPEITEEDRYLFPIAIQVLESGIFDKDGLGGQKGEDPFPIPNLAKFVKDLCLRLLWYKFLAQKSGADDSIDDHLIRIGENIARLTIELRLSKGKRAARLVGARWRKLKTLVEKIKTYPNRPLKMPDHRLKKDILNIFLKHTRAPKATIAWRAAQLLKKLGIPATEEGLRALIKPSKK